MKRILPIAFFLFGLLFGIGYHPSSGEEVFPPEREYHFRHHSGTEDYNFFGPSTWAVRFDFRSKYSSVSEVYFTTRGARLYFPSIGNDAMIQLYSDNAGEPGTLIEFATITVDDHIIDHHFNTQYSAEAAWLFVDYQTNILNKFVAASAGGGSHSYYMQEYGDIQTLTNFEQNGFAAELLFGLLGDYVFPQDGLELEQISFAGDILPGNPVYPVLKVYNHSHQMAYDTRLNLIFSRPGETGYENLEFSVPQNLFGQTQHDIELTSATFLLPSEPTQLRIEAKISSSLVENDTLLVNNKKTVNLNVYQDEYPIYLVENFVRSQDANTIRYYQDSVLSEKMHPIEYYPLLTDEPGNIPSQQRFNDYRFNSLPRTMIVGEKLISGLNASYSQNFQNATNGLSKYRSFISRSTLNLVDSESAARKEVTIRFDNDNTHLFDTQAANPVLNSKLHVGLFNLSREDDGNYYILSKWIARADTINHKILKGQSAGKSYSFSTVGLDDGYSSDYRIYYWLQQGGTGKIHHVGYKDFSMESEGPEHEEETPQVAIEIYPNPGYGQQDFNCKLNGEGGRVTVYNLRGQKIFEEKQRSSTLELSSRIFPSSGIYFIRYEEDGGRYDIKKLSIIK